MSRIALTGATGFVGAVVLKELLVAGHQVKVLVRRPRAEQFSSGVDVVQGDLDDKVALGQWVQGADTVVHVAGAISAFSEAQYFKVNYEGTRNVFAAARLAGARRFVYVSSLAARQPEISPYAASKRAAEDFLLSEHQSLASLVLRPSAVYGPGDKATLPLVAALQKSVALIPGRAGARFSLVHVADFARVIAAAVNDPRTGLLEIDDTEGGHDWRAVAALNRGATGKPRKVVFLPKGLVSGVALVSEWSTLFTGQVSMVNRGKVHELYHPDWVVRGEGWPRANPIKIAEGLAQTVAWYQSQGWLPPVRQKDRSAP